jgi:hypothetical protein
LNARAETLLQLCFTGFCTVSLYRPLFWLWSAWPNVVRSEEQDVGFTTGDTVQHYSDVGQTIRSGCEWLSEQDRALLVPGDWQGTGLLQTLGRE